jgi:hypothetical protein
VNSTLYFVIVACAAVVSCSSPSGGNDAADEAVEEVFADPLADDLRTDESPSDTDLREPEWTEPVEVVEEIRDTTVDEVPPPPLTAQEICDNANPDKIGGCRNGSETCDDFRFTVPEGPLVLACHASPVGYQGDGIGYIAFNSGPPCTQDQGCCPAEYGVDCDVTARLFSAGNQRCRGWEDCGCAGQICPCELPWDHLQYVSDGLGEIKVTCTREGVIRDIDLSAYVGDALYGGVHTQPDRTTGLMSTVCVARKTW